MKLKLSIDAPDTVEVLREELINLSEYKK